MFFNGSRYQRVLDADFSDALGRGLTLKRTREPVDIELAMIYQVREGDRLDLLAQKFFQDARKWWLIADANPDLPTLEQVLQPGQQLRIPKNRNA